VQQKVFFAQNITESAFSGFGLPEITNVFLLW